jgi:hypothetical protein
MPTDDDDTPRIAPTPGPRSRTVLGERGEVRRPDRGPRQDDAPASSPVPREFALDHEPITGVHPNQPELELIARTTRTQHVTEGIAAQTLALGAKTLDIGTRVNRVEARVVGLATDIDGVKADVSQLHAARAVDSQKLDVIQASLNAQDKLLAPLAQVAASAAALTHTKIRADIDIDAAQVQAATQVGAAQKIDSIDKRKQWRERVTRIFAIVSSLAALALAALHVSEC